MSFADLRKHARCRSCAGGSSATRHAFTTGHETACKKSFKSGASELISLLHILLACAEERVADIPSLARELD
eukprot:2572072-Pyramimonas_sp.AAC.1